MQFEAVDFLGGNMHGVQQKYATWKVSQAAYIKKLGEVKDAIDWANISTKLADVKTYNTQSKVYHKMLYDLENAINAKDMALAQQLLSDTEAKRQQLMNLKAKEVSKAMALFRLIQMLTRKQERMLLFGVNPQPRVISYLMPRVMLLE